MPWPCYMVVSCGEWFHLPEDPHHKKILLFEHLRPGTMWLDEGELCVKLPSGSEWNIDRGRLLNEAKTGRTFPAWTRAGEPPQVTARPSINHVGHYHGWLTDGILSDDLEGRIFP